MSVQLITNRLPERQAKIVEAVFEKACLLLDHSPRFKLFTLHGRNHLSELFRIADIMIQGGIILNERQTYLLSLGICTHDLGMVVGLSDADLTEISEGRGGVPDPVNFENFIRDVHHEIITRYFRNDLNFLTSLGVTVADLGIIAEIGECHRKVPLRDRKGDIRVLGALLRVIDELDTGSSRAPASIFENTHFDMDEVSKWHWFKHTITEDWHIGHNVEFHTGGKPQSIIFNIAVRPTRAESIPYWITQVARPINKALRDDDAQAIILESFGVKIELNRTSDLSRPNKLGGIWEKIEECVLTQGRKVILVVDDEVKKIEDLFFPLMETYHVKCIPYIKAAFQFLDTVKVDLVIVDLQMPTQDLWLESEVDESRMTGFKFAEETKTKWPETKICILTGTKHPISADAQNSVDLFLRKPIDPFELQSAVDTLLNASPQDAGLH